MTTATADSPRAKRGRAQTGRAQTGRDRARRARPQSSYPEALTQKVRALTDRLGRAQEGEIRAMVEIGREVQVILADKQTYAVDSFKDLAALFKTGRDSLRPAYVLASRYSDDQLDTLLSLKNPDTGAGLFRSHLAVLTRVKDAEKAIEVAREAVKHGWTREQLAAHVVKAQGKGSAGGKPRKPVHTLAELCDSVLTKVQDWEAQDVKVWRPKHGGLAAFREAIEKRKEVPDNKTMQLLEDAKTAAVRMANFVNLLVADLGQTYTKALAARAAAA